MVILLQSVATQFRTLFWHIAKSNKVILLLSVTGCYYKLCQISQRVTDCYYKVFQVLQSVTVITR